MTDPEAIEKKRAIKRRLLKLEEQINDAITNDKCSKLMNLETEMHILSIFLEVLECSMKDINYLSKKNMSLHINKTLLEELDYEVKMSILCLTEGICGIK